MSKKTVSRLSNDKISAKVMADCAKVVNNNQSHLNPKGKIEWIASGDSPFAAIRMDGVFTLEHLLQIGDILTKGRTSILKHKEK